MKNTKWALITGASAGIGAEFAQQLAAAGYSLLLVARREDKLLEIQSALQEKFNIECRYIVKDLSIPSANLEIFEFCHNNNIRISYLVNNAGYGVPGDFDSVDWETHHEMLQVMLTSVTELTHLFYPAMKAQREGFIINIASLAGLVIPTAGHTLYGAVKSYLIKFSHSLHLEAKDSNVHVTALCPGFTYSEFHDVNGTRGMVSKMSKKMWMKAEDVVAQGLAAVKQNQAVYVNGWRNRMIANLVKILPEKLVRFLMKGSIKKYRKR
ncbi:MAG: SDR family oxidoreductase [Marinicella sp.]